jgi:hypothetical protein
LPFLTAVLMTTAFDDGLVAPQHPPDDEWGFLLVMGTAMATDVPSRSIRG